VATVEVVVVVDVVAAAAAAAVVVVAVSEVFHRESTANESFNRQRRDAHATRDVRMTRESNR
jgi:hypothetical protein